MNKLMIALLALIPYSTGCGNSDESGSSGSGGDAANHDSGSGASAGSGNGNDANSQESSSGCVETRTLVSPDEETSLGFTGGDVLTFVAGSHEAILTWPDGSTTAVTFTTDSADAYFVESVPDPDFTLDIAVSCSDHLQVDTSAAFVTADGQLDQYWSALVFRADGTDVALAVDNIEIEDLGGDYTPEVGASECLLALQFNMALEPAGFSGTLLDTIAGAPCDSIGDMTGVSPRNAGSWEPL